MAKRPSEEEEEGRPAKWAKGQDGHAGSQTAAVAAHYSARGNQDHMLREISPIANLRKVNNWIKSIMIQRYTNSGDAVLDLACGKGGDFQKWNKAGISFVFGSDISAGSVEDARLRFNESLGGRGGAMRFSAQLVCADYGQPELEKLLLEGDYFDACSCQFALHYSWADEQRARQALRSATCRLKPGGVFFGTIPDANVLVRKLRASEGLEFGNELYRVSFHERHASKRFPSSRPYGLEYTFCLQDAIDPLPEFMIPFETFVSLAGEYGLELEHRSNFQLFVLNHSADSQWADLAMRVGLNTDEGGNIEISPDEWDAAYLYMVFVFRKDGNATADHPRRRGRSGPKEPIPSTDLLYLNGLQRITREAK